MELITAGFHDRRDLDAARRPLRIRADALDAHLVERVVVPEGRAEADSSARRRPCTTASPPTPYARDAGFSSIIWPPPTSVNERTPGASVNTLITLLRDGGRELEDVVRQQRAPGGR